MSSVSPTTLDFDDLMIGVQSARDLLKKSSLDLCIRYSSEVTAEIIPSLISELSDRLGDLTRALLADLQIERGMDSFHIPELSYLIDASPFDVDIALANRMCDQMVISAPDQESREAATTLLSGFTLMWRFSQLKLDLSRMPCNAIQQIQSVSVTHSGLRSVLVDLMRWVVFEIICIMKMFGEVGSIDRQRAILDFASYLSKNLFAAPYDCARFPRQAFVAARDTSDYERAIPYIDILLSLNLLVERIPPPKTQRRVGGEPKKAVFIEY